MTRRHVPPAAIALLVAAWVFAPSGASAQSKGDAGKADKAGKSSNSKADEAGATKVYLFKAEKRVKSAAGESLTLVVSDPFTGKTETFHVAGNDPASKEYDPVTEIRELVEGGLDVGTPIEVTTQRVKGKLTATSAKKAAAKPGEELPNGFVFVETREDDKTKAVDVTLSKFGREVVVGVPMVKDDEYRDAKWEPDPKVDYVVRRLQAGDVVEVLTRKQSNRVMISEIYAYLKPERGKFMGLKEVEFNSLKAAGFEIAAEDGTTLTFTLTGAEQSRNGQKMFTPNPQQLAMVKKLKKDTDVEVRYTLDGRTWMLRDVRALPAGAKTEKKTAAPAAKPAKDKDMTRDAAPPAADDDMEKDDGKEKKDDMEKPKAEKD